jgi:3-methylfumaryl-CoA hydratase
MAERLEDLKSYVGKKATSADVATAHTIAKLAATLDVEHPAPNKGDPIPHGWHGGFFPGAARGSTLREDGQPSGGGITPPVPLPRRRVGITTAAYHDHLRIGDELSRVSEIKSVEVEDRGAGPLVTVTQRDSISSPRGLAVVEERGFYYFGPNGPGRMDAAPTPAANAPWRAELKPDPVRVWRLCAYRFNSHRIHFDRDYTTKVEGYPGIVVPVTLISQEMIEMCRQRQKRELATFSYRSIEIVADTGPYTILGAPSADGSSASFWCINAEGRNALHGEAKFR